LGGKVEDRVYVLQNWAKIICGEVARPHVDAVGGQVLGIVSLDAWVVKRRKRIDASNVMARLRQSLRKVRSDKARRAGDEDAHTCWFIIQIIYQAYVNVRTAGPAAHQDFPASAKR
jgi:hypothetical protein